MKKKRLMKKNRLMLPVGPIDGLTDADMLREAERRVIGRIFKDKASGRICRGHFVQLDYVKPDFKTCQRFYFFDCYYVPLDVTEITLQDVD